MPTLHPVDPLTYSPDETYQRALIVTGDPVFANKARQAAWAERDAERDALLRWNEAAQAFKAVLS
jgi:hypothetical protein